MYCDGQVFYESDVKYETKGGFTNHVDNILCNDHLPTHCWHLWRNFFTEIRENLIFITTYVLPTSSCQHSLWMPQIVFQFMHPILEKKIRTSTPLWCSARRVTASLVTSDNEAIQPNEKASDFQQYEFGLVFHVKPYRTSKNFVFLWQFTVCLW